MLSSSERMRGWAPRDFKSDTLASQYSVMQEAQRAMPGQLLGWEASGRRKTEETHWSSFRTTETISNPARLPKRARCRATLPPPPKTRSLSDLLLDISTE